MRRFLVLSAIVAFLFISVKETKAQDTPILLGGNVLINAPVGDFGDLANLSFGFNAKGEFGVAENISIIGQIGFIPWSIDSDIYDNYSYSTLMIRAGGRYYLSAEEFRPYIEGDLGYYSHTTSYDSQFGEFDDTDSDIGIRLAGGGMLELSPGLFLNGELGFNIVSEANFIEIQAGVMFAI